MEYNFITYTKNHTLHNLLRIKDIPPIQSLPLHETLTHIDKWDDMAVEHKFKLSELIKEATDDEGFWYKWYKVEEHERTEYDVSPFGMEVRKNA
jgi:hypothetical protein